MELGQHCDFVGCNQLDFLPSTCSACTLVFCTNHRSFTEHLCTKWDESSVKANGTVSVSIQPAKTVEETIRPDRPVPNLQYGKALVPAASAAAARSAAAVNKPTKKRSPQLELMKMKLHAKGDESIPAAQRVYIHLVPPKEASTQRAMDTFFNKTTTLGRVLDKSASLFSVVNVNSSGSPEKQLYLYNGDTGVRLLPSDTLEVFQHGDSLILERGQAEFLDVVQYS